MTDSMVASLRAGDVVLDTSIGIRFRVTADARMSRACTHHEAYAVTASGALVTRVTHHSGNFKIVRRRTPR